MTQEKCNNCGQQLTEENIYRALEDAGEYVGQGIASKVDSYAFCCPSYTDKKGCRGYSKRDRTKPAYWRTME